MGRDGEQGSGADTRRSRVEQSGLCEGGDSASGRVPFPRGKGTKRRRGTADIGPGLCPVLQPPYPRTPRDARKRHRRGWVAGCSARMFSRRALCPAGCRPCFQNRGSNAPNGASRLGCGCVRCVEGGTPRSPAPAFTVTQAQPNEVVVLGRLGPQACLEANRRRAAALGPRWGARKRSGYPAKPGGATRTLRRRGEGYEVPTDDDTPEP